MLVVFIKDSDMFFGRVGDKLVVTLFRNDELIGDIYF